MYYVGFAANNISESYDAKIFSVATLLSSYLIYNSVKVYSVVTVNVFGSVSGVVTVKHFHQHIDSYLLCYVDN